MKYASPSLSFHTLIYLGNAFIYVYYVLSLCWLLSGLPVLAALLSVWVKEDPRLLPQTRHIVCLHVFVHSSYWLANTSHVLRPVFAWLIWNLCGLIILYRYPVSRNVFRPLLDRLHARIRAYEDRFALYVWPLLDFDGNGILALKKSTVDLEGASFIIGSIDLSYQVDEYTRIIAKLDNIRVRLGRDITIGEVYLNVKGEGMPAYPARFVVPLSEMKEKVPLSRTSTVQDGPPPYESTSISPVARPPPPLPPRKINAEVVAEEPRQSIDSERSATDPHDPAFFYNEDIDTNEDDLRAALAESAISTNPLESDKATIAANLADQSAQYTAERTVELHSIIEQIPWWARITIGPLMTRLILAPVLWLHPVKIDSIACSGSGKRITNVMEMNGFKKSHANPEIFRLIRKIFLWLEMGDVSVIVHDVDVRASIPIASDQTIRVDLKAGEPTVFQNTSDAEEVLAKLSAVRISLQLPIYFLPNHIAHRPRKRVHRIPVDVMLSLPGIFNRELLTIGAAFMKASTMMDLQRTAQTRALPTLSQQGQFSFRSFGAAVKQVAGDIAKQKGVEWGIRDKEIAKWVSKFANLMKWMNLDIGGSFEIPINIDVENA